MREIGEVEWGQDEGERKDRMGEMMEERMREWGEDERKERREIGERMGE